jgi:hypothetical protein
VWHEWLSKRHRGVPTVRDSALRSPCRRRTGLAGC